ncbi:hypothetical protein SAMN05892883_4016 [Jatrophihabitans sp. GAS493]|uniref:hypothetical protein n=1 Tax=Jatrophihabitans sp. GAS493 TaxID=1907575 RepID=UPI000BB84813|nr:hypothetical protein [Jatrophihabitans sp. GAS493]SOD74824.1 hypothetical protein SAMN05892883_4016 [Jatrophihabitans sp. GAS493]
MTHSLRGDDQPVVPITGPSVERPIDLGLGGAWGFSKSDRTSPVKAGLAGSLPDAGTFTDGLNNVTELRIHGVSGSDGPTILEHPHALQVGGDATTMFYRRWSPSGSGPSRTAGLSVPWKLEAYSWGGLTESPLASASWILLAPFMLYNLAHFALPPAKEYVAEVTTKADPTVPPPAQRLSRDGKHAVAQTLLRLLALTATVEFIVAVAAIFLNSFAFQARLAHFPSWLGWFTRWTVGERMAAALAAVAVVIVLLWLISVKTAHSYERRTTENQSEVRSNWLLSQTRFWNGLELVRRQRSLHAAAAAASTALIAARPTFAHSPGGYRIFVCLFAGAVLLAVSVTLCLNLADRHSETLTFDRPVTKWSQAAPATWVCRTLLGAAALALLASVFTTGWPSLNEPTQAATLPGLTNICLIVLLVQLGLLVVLGVVVVLVKRAAPVLGTRRPSGSDPFWPRLLGRPIGTDGPERRQLTGPFAYGHLATVFATLAVCLGGTFSALVTLFATRLVGTPLPSGGAATSGATNPLQIPWPIYAFALEPIGVLIGVLIAIVWVWRTYVSNWKTFDRVPKRNERARYSAIADFYESHLPVAPTAEPALDAPMSWVDDSGHSDNKTQTAKSWAIGLLVDQAGVVGVCAVIGGVLATLIGEIAGAAGDSPFGSHLHGLAVAESLIGLFLAGVVVAMLRADFKSESSRKSIGAIWDVATFWPRATHPFAPPCYAERAIPELVDRIRILTETVPNINTLEGQLDPATWQVQDHLQNEAQPPIGPTVPARTVLLTGYSQGSIIAPAVIAQLPAQTMERVSLMTLACPARRLYGRAFPAYFRESQLRTLNAHLGVAGSGAGAAESRWKNLVRRTDYIGSWIFQPFTPVPRPDFSVVSPEVDQPCWDPVTIAHNLDQAPPPTQFHTAFWADVRANQLGEHLIRRLGVGGESSGLSADGLTPAGLGPAGLSETEEPEGDQA